MRLHGAEVVKVDEDVPHVHHNMVQKTKKKDCTITKLHKQVLRSKQSENFHCNLYLCDNSLKCSVKNGLSG